MPVLLLSRLVVRFAAATLLSGLPVVLVGCEGPTDVNAPVRAVVVDPVAETVFTGGSVTFTAVALDPAGETVAQARFTWQSSDTAVAVVDTAGTVTARRRGMATITARAGNGVGAATVHVSSAEALGFVQPVDGGRNYYWKRAIDLLPGDLLTLLLASGDGPATPPARAPSGHRQTRRCSRCNPFFRPGIPASGCTA